MEDSKYHPEIHITAGELRAVGFEIDDKIPDCAWIRKTSIVPGNVSTYNHYFDVNFNIVGSFCWFEFTGTFEI